MLAEAMEFRPCVRASHEFLPHPGFFSDTNKKITAVWLVQEPHRCGYAIECILVDYSPNLR